MSSQKIMLMILCVWLLAAHFSLTSGQQSEVYPSPVANYWCFPCGPGFYVTQHCTKDLTNSSCMPCPSGTYEDDFNTKTFCKPCTKLKCLKYLLFCSETQGTQCVCKEGYYKISTNSSNDECRALSTCQSGQGEVFHGNSTHDSICVLCKVGFEFVDRQDKEHPVCRKCSVCQSSEILSKKCTLYTDTKCKPKPTLFLTNTDVYQSPEISLHKFEQDMNGSFLFHVYCTARDISHPPMALSLRCGRVDKYDRSTNSVIISLMVTSKKNSTDCNCTAIYDARTLLYNIDVHKVLFADNVISQIFYIATASENGTNITVWENEAVTFVCRPYYWNNDSLKLHKGSQLIENAFSNFSHIYTIDNVKCSDSGEYWCKTTKYKGANFSSVTLFVHCDTYNCTDSEECRLNGSVDSSCWNTTRSSQRCPVPCISCQTDLPDINDVISHQIFYIETASENGTKITVWENEAVTFVCRPYYWNNDSLKLHKGSQLIENAFSNFSHIYTIDKVKCSDSGEYWCTTAKNKGANLSSVTLFVHCDIYNCTDSEECRLNGSVDSSCWNTTRSSQRCPVPCISCQTDLPDINETFLSPIITITLSVSGAIVVSGLIIIFFLMKARGATNNRTATEECDVNGTIFPSMCTSRISWNTEYCPLSCSLCRRQSQRESVTSSVHIVTIVVSALGTVIVATIFCVALRKTREAKFRYRFFPCKMVERITTSSLEL